MGSLVEGVAMHCCSLFVRSKGSLLLAGEQVGSRMEIFGLLRRCCCSSLPIRTTRSLASFRIPAFGVTALLSLPSGARILPASRYSRCASWLRDEGLENRRIAQP